MSANPLQSLRAFWFLTAVWLVGTGVAMAREPSGDGWEKLENCQLVESDYFDGDSFHVKHAGKSSHFRLYFVDTPETDTRFPDRVAEQAKHFGVPVKEVLRVGKEAGKVTQRLLSRPFTVFTKWEDARGQSKQKRYYAVARLADGRTLQEALVEGGWARAFGMPAEYPDRGGKAAFMARLRALESKARSARSGGYGGGKAGAAAAGSSSLPGAPTPGPEESPTPGEGPSVSDSISDSLNDLLDPAGF